VGRSVERFRTAVHAAVTTAPAMVGVYAVLWLPSMLIATAKS
jgi:hypothetical protein